MKVGDLVVWHGNKNLKFYGETGIVTKLHEYTIDNNRKVSVYWPGVQSICEHWYYNVSVISEFKRIKRNKNK